MSRPFLYFSSIFLKENSQSKFYSGNFCELYFENLRLFKFSFSNSFKFAGASEYYSPTGIKFLSNTISYPLSCMLLIIPSSAAGVFFAPSCISTIEMPVTLFLFAIAQYKLNHQNKDICQKHTIDRRCHIWKALRLSPVCPD